MLSCYVQMCVIANACPENVDEALAFIPSLKVRLLELPVSDVCVVIL